MALMETLFDLPDEIAPVEKTKAGTKSRKQTGDQPALIEGVAGTKTRQKKVKKEKPAPVKPEYDPALLVEALAAPLLALDTETDTEYHGIGPDSGVGKSYVADVTTLALVWRKDGELKSLVMGMPFTESEFAAIREIMTNTRLDFPYSAINRTVIAHNAVFDMRQLSRLSGGEVPAHIWDTMAMARLLHPGKLIRFGNRFALLYVVKALGIPYPEYMNAMKEQRDDLHNVDPRLVAQYCEDDTRLVYLIYEAQQAYIKGATTKALVDWECRAIRVFSKMAARGVLLNMEYTQERIAHLTALTERLKADLAADGLLEPSKDRQVREYIYGKKGVPFPTWEPGSHFFTESGHDRIVLRLTRYAQQEFNLRQEEVTIDNIVAMADKYPEAAKPTINDMSLCKEALDELLKGDNDWSELLSKFAAWNRADYLLTVMKTLVEHAAIDGAVHSIVTLKTRTGRRASESPQVQNWKIGDTGNSIIGDMSGVVRGRLGFTLVEIDYSNAENWIQAMIAGDSALAKACDSADFHSSMAAVYFPAFNVGIQKIHEITGKPKDLVFVAVNDEKFREQVLADLPAELHETVKSMLGKLYKLRKSGKSLTFGKAYGMGMRKLARSIKSTLEEAKAILDQADVSFPFVASVKRDVTYKAKKSGFVLLWTGRPIAIGSPKLAYTGWNSVCQGGVGELVKRAIVITAEQFEAAGMRSYPALDMHDAVVWEVAHDEWDKALQMASYNMEHVMPEEFNRRTDPPIRWIAQPEFDVNKEKWGKEQLHPGDPDFNLIGRQGKVVLHVNSREWKAIPENQKLYIGRDFGGHTDQGYGNPYKAPAFQEPAEEYRAYFLRHPELWERVYDPQITTLGCWCTNKHCHGDVILDIVKNYRFWVDDTGLICLLPPGQSGAVGPFTTYASAQSYLDTRFNEVPAPAVTTLETSATDQNQRETAESKTYPELFFNGASSGLVARFRNVTVKEFTNDELWAAHEFFTQVRSLYDKEVNGARESLAPKETPGGFEAIEVKVDALNQIFAGMLWLKLADRVDLEALIGLNAAELSRKVEQRQAEYENNTDKLAKCEKIQERIGLEMITRGIL